MIDPLDRAQHPLVIRPHRAAQRLQGLADHRDRGFEGVCVVLRGTPDRRRRAVQCFDHAVELGGDFGEFRDFVAGREAAGRAALLADLPREPGEPAQPAADAEQCREGDHDHREIDRRRDLDGRRRPIGLAEMGAGKRVSGERGHHRPAAGRGQQRGHRGDDLRPAGRPVVQQRKRHLAAAALGKPIENALCGQQLALGFEIVAGDRRP